MVTTTRTQDFTLRREYLLDYITQRFAHQIPLLSLLPREHTPHTVIDYGIDAPFASGDAVRAISNPHGTSRLEGGDFVDDDLGQPTKLRCITEIKHRSHKMTGSAIPAVVAGMQNPWDYNSGKLFTKLLNEIDNSLMYGIGSPEVNGTTNPRISLGLIGWSAVTGLERMHGVSSPTAIQDPYGISVPSAYWSVFYDAENKNLTSDLMNSQILIPAKRNGAVINGWIWQVGYQLMAKVSRFVNPESGVRLIERTMPSTSSEGSDYMMSFRFPTGDIATFMTNRWLDENTLTYSFGSVDPITPSAPTSPGTVAARTFAGNATMIGHEPGRVRTRFYRDPQFRKIETVGDYSRVAALAEYTLQVDHPLCVAGGGNLLA